MKRAVQTLILLLIALVSGLLLYLFAAPHFLASPLTPPSPSVPPSAGVSPSAPASEAVPTLSGGPIAPPRNSQQREAESIEARRAPYYRWLREKFGDVLADEQPNPSDAATLDLTTSRYDVRFPLYLVAQAVQPYADQYGFDHVRIFQPNPAGSVERYRFDSEASPDRNGAWHTFAK